MKQIKRVGCAILAFLVLCSVLAAAAPQTGAAEQQPTLEKVILKPETEQSHTMKISEQIQLVVDDAEEEPEEGGNNGSAEPEEGSSSAHQPGSGTDEKPGHESGWQTEHESIVTVDENGIVTAVGEGTAKVFKDVPKGVVWCEITVSGYAVTELKLTADDTMQVGDTQTIQASIIPEQAETKLDWTSDNEKVLTVSDAGTVTAGVAGRAEITAKAENGITASISITVSELPLNSISIVPSSVTIDLSKKPNNREVSIKTNPEGIKLNAVTWSSSNAAVAKVDQTGKVTAVKKGTAVITAKAGSLTATCVVTVITPTTVIPNSKPNTNSYYYNFNYSNGTGGILYLPGSIVTSNALYTMPQNIPAAAYLTIDSDLGTDTETIVDTLNSGSLSATFFVPLDNLYAADDVLRHIAGSGNSIGFLLTAEQANAENTVQRIEAANQQLSVITGTPTRLIRIAGGSSGNITSEKATELIDAGYRLWDWNTAARETAISSDSAYQAVSKAMNTVNSVTIRFGSNASTAAVLRQLMPYIKYCGIPAKAISSGDIPVCHTAVG